MKQKKFSSRMAAAVSTLVLAVGLTVFSVSAVSASAASASVTAARTTASEPAVSFSFTQPTVYSGTQPKLTYSSRNLPAGARIFLQLAYGTPAQWDFVKPLGGASGTVTLQSLPTGLYDFRAVAERGISVVAISPTRYLSVIQPPSSSCGICSILGGIGGAVVTWLLSLIPW
jgi:hypothetical protein